MRTPVTPLFSISTATPTDAPEAHRPRTLAAARFHRSLLAACAATLCSLVVAAPRGVDLFTFLASGHTPFRANCNGAPQTGVLYTNAEVEPFVAANPLNPLNLVGVWQQDRWSNGGAQGLATASSFDGGVHWTRSFPPFTRCAGGTAANGGNYERGSDPWVSFSPNGVVHQMVLSINNDPPAHQDESAMLASRSIDGGRTWGPITTLVVNQPGLFNDKNTITADPTDSRYVYAVWDRLDFARDEGPTLMARSTDNGRSWEPARIIYDPGEHAQTIGNRIEVLPNGTLVNLMTQIDYLTEVVRLRVIRSTDKGRTWSAPITISDMLVLGASDPETGAAIRDGAILGQLAISPRGVISVVWQDARFSDGRVDGIVLSQSSDGGLSWSAPVQINRDPLVQAFTPSIHVRQNGGIGITYFDLRSNTSDPATLPTDTWLTVSQDGLNWRESRVTAGFDLARAPNALGYFIGDYHGLTSIGPFFIPFFAKSGGSNANRNDVFSHFSIGNFAAKVVGRSASLEAQVARDEAALPLLSVQGTGRTSAALPDTTRSALRAATRQAVEKTMRARIPNWDERRATPPATQ